MLAGRIENNGRGEGQEAESRSRSRSRRRRPKSKKDKVALAPTPASRVGRDGKAIVTVTAMGEGTGTGRRERGGENGTQASPTLPAGVVSLGPQPGRGSGRAVPLVHAHVMVEVVLPAELLLAPREVARERCSKAPARSASAPALAEENRGEGEGGTHVFR